MRADFDPVTKTVNHTGLKSVKPTGIGVPMNFRSLVVPAQAPAPRGQGPAEEECDGCEDDVRQ
jgi:hypothetical protein